MCGPTVGAAQRLAGQEQNLCGCESSLIAFQQLSCLNEKKNVFFKKNRKAITWIARVWRAAVLSLSLQ